MDTKQFITGTLAGGVAFFILGYLIYGLLLEGFFTANAGTVTGAQRPMDEIVWWALIVANLSLAALISYIFLKWAHISTFKRGLRAGAAIGLLLNVSIDLMMYSTSNLMNFKAALVDIIVWTIAVAIVGGIIGAVLHAKPHREPVVA